MKWSPNLAYYMYDRISINRHNASRYSTAKKGHAKMIRISAV